MNKRNTNKFINKVLAINNVNPKESGALGFMARALVQATIPHSKPSKNTFKRQNGFFKLTILSDPEVGLPYGSIPRLLIAWITTEAIRTKQRELVLGDSLSEFMIKLDLIPTGGRWGSITRLKEQMKRLFSSSISCTYDNGNLWAIKNVQPISEANLWWSPKKPEQLTIFKSTITLGVDFFNEIISRPVPINMDALKALKKSPMALDIYCWITYRISYIEDEVTIPWENLKFQFGSNYKRTRDFKRYFVSQLGKVQAIYPHAHIVRNSEGLTLYPSKTHIPKI